MATAYERSVEDPYAERDYVLKAREAASRIPVTDERRIYANLHDVGGQIDTLEEVIKRLTDRLDAVLAPEGPQAALRGDRQDSPAESPLALALRTHAERLGTANEQLRELLDRIEA